MIPFQKINTIHCLTYIMDSIYNKNVGNLMHRHGSNLFESLTEDCNLHHISECKFTEIDCPVNHNHVGKNWQQQRKFDF